MDLINNLPIAAKVVVADIEGQSSRIGVVTAKATFTFSSEGSVQLEMEHPFPLYDQNLETDLGYLPRDDLPRRDPAFEVILLGAAYSPKGQPVEKLQVALEVGNERRELMIFGVRKWEDDLSGQKQIAEPIPFVRMPLTYSKAFGGSCDVLIDRDAVITVSDPHNREGLGFNPEPSAEAICKTLKSPGGYPRFDPTRYLPNVEDPKHLISNWDDTPKPACWSTVPMDSALQALRSVKIPDDFTMPETLICKEGIFHQACPDWVIDLPDSGVTVLLENLTPEGYVSFEFPSLRVFVDYVIGDRKGIRELKPQMIVLLPDEKRFYLVYRHAFMVEFIPEVERCMRLRIE